MRRLTDGSWLARPPSYPPIQPSKSPPSSSQVSPYAPSLSPSSSASSSDSIPDASEAPRPAQARPSGPSNMNATDSRQSNNLAAFRNVSCSTKKSKRYGIMLGERRFRRFFLGTAPH
eukprot:GHVT01060835.1.p2 GENE.GHVT01060835.1~~GHVT01060835.1.p2  ORF type:complete len:117 (-),score=20.34 GHVT01060835.1:1244-1594(-)